MLKKLLFTTLIITILFACKNEAAKYKLKWKIPAQKVVIYSIQMKTIDSLSSVSEESMQSVIELVSKMYGDSIKVNLSASGLYKGLMQQLNMLSYFAIIRSGEANDLKIDFITRQTKQYEPIKYKEIFNKFIKKAFFKGVLKNNGVLLTNASAEAWDPKINILFQLPQNPVAIGESWDLNIIPEWQKNQTDSNLVNKVTLDRIDLVNGDSIATLKYNLQSSNQGGKTLGYTGNAKFNITTGKWAAYRGNLSQKTSGMLSMKQVQSIKLTEISVSKYKSILKQAQQTNIFDVGKDFKKQAHKAKQTESNKENKELKQSEVTKSNCPEVFRVQLMAAKTPIKNVKSKFANIPYSVNQIVLNNSDYKYKYTVGAECNREKANILLQKIKKLYPNAYIIKTPAE